MRKKLISVVLALTLAGLLCGCGGGDGTKEEASGSGDTTAKETEQESGSDAKGETLKIGCVVKFQHEFYTSLMEGAKKAADELGCEIETMAPSSPSDVTGQVQMVEDLVAKGIDILLIAPNQAETLKNVFDVAVEKGVKIIAVDTDLPDYENKTAFVGTGNYEAVKYGATELSKLLPDGANVVVLRGPLGDANHELRSAGAVDGLEEAGCNVLEVFDAESTAEKASAAAEDFLLKYKSEGIDAFLCCDDEMAVGTVTAIKQAGKGEDILVTGYDGNAAAVEMVGSKDMAFDLAQNPFEMGYQGVEVGVKAMKGEAFEETVDTGVQIITKDNYKDFLS